MFQLFVLKMDNTMRVSVVLILISACAISADWITVNRDTYITYDLETTPLQIKTDTVAGTKEMVRVIFYTANERLVSGGIDFFFDDPPTYFIRSCSSNWTPFSEDLPAEETKVWTITETLTTVKIACNEVELVTYTFSDSNSDCVTQWSKDTGTMQFVLSVDTASDEFRAKPGIYTMIIILIVFCLYFLCVITTCLGIP